MRRRIVGPRRKVVEQARDAVKLECGHVVAKTGWALCAKSHRRRTCPTCGEQATLASRRAAWDRAIAQAKGGPP